MIHAVVSHALRVDFAHYPIDADGLMGETVEAGFAHRVDEGGKGVLRSRGDPQQQRVAEVPDGALGCGSAIGYRHRDQEIRCARVAAHQYAEARQQHHERRRGVLAREALHAAEQIGGQRPGSALGPSGRMRRSNTRQLQRLGRRPQHVGPVADVGDARFRRGLEHLDRDKLWRGRARLVAVVGGAELAEEDVP